MHDLFSPNYYAGRKSGLNELVRRSRFIYPPLVTNNLSSKPPDKIEFGVLISHCRKLLSKLPNFLVCFVKRQASLVAHRLATKFQASSCYFSEIPLCIADYDVAPCRACRPWTFFINGVLCFLKINDSGMEKEER